MRFQLARDSTRYPGKLDHMVAGGLSHGERPGDNVIRERQPSQVGPFVVEVATCLTLVGGSSARGTDALGHGRAVYSGSWISSCVGLPFVEVVSALLWGSCHVFRFLLRLDWACPLLFEILRFCGMRKHVLNEFFGAWR